MKRNLKKIFVKAFLSILFITGVIEVNALDAKLSLECSKDEVVVLQSITCNVNINTDANINNISFVIENNGFNVTFDEENGFTKNGTDNGISLHKQNITTGKIGTLNILAPGNISEGSKAITIKNIVMTNSEDETIVFNNDNLIKNINVLSNKSNNNKLKDLTIDDKTIKDFNQDKDEYEIIVNTNKVTIGAVSDHEKAQIEGSGEKTLIIGDNKYEIKVTAENGQVKIYKLNIKYVIPKSSDNTLKSLELYFNEEKIDFTYDIAKTEFNIDVLSNVNEITIESELNDEKASYVKKYENRDVKLNYGKNKIEIRVKAEDDQVKSYVLNINREDDRNSNKTLSKLVVNDEEVILSSSIFEYRVDVRYKYERSEIIATPTSEKATVSYNNIDLVDGENTPIVITVTAENGEKQEYKLVINRLSEEMSKVVLQNIVIEGYEFPFDPKIESYNLTLKNNDKSLKINILPKENIEYDIINNENLGDGSTVIIRVNDDDGERRYKINIYKENDEILGIDTNIFCYIVFGIGVISLISSITYVTIINKKRK